MLRRGAMGWFIKYVDVLGLLENTWEVLGGSLSLEHSVWERRCTLLYFFVLMQGQFFYCNNRFQQTYASFSSTNKLVNNLILANSSGLAGNSNLA